MPSACPRGIAPPRQRPDSLGGADPSAALVQQRTELVMSGAIVRGTCLKSLPSLMVLEASPLSAGSRASGSAQVA